AAQSARHHSRRHFARRHQRLRRAHPEAHGTAGCNRAGPAGHALRRHPVLRDLLRPLQDLQPRSLEEELLMDETAIGAWGVPLAILAGAIRVSTPFIFVSLGETITERSGRINLGLEGTLVFGAMTAYAVAVMTNSPWLGVLAAMATGCVFGIVHGW